MNPPTTTKPPTFPKHRSGADVLAERGIWKADFTYSDLVAMAPDGTRSMSVTGMVLAAFRLEPGLTTESVYQLFPKLWDQQPPEPPEQLLPLDDIAHFSPRQLLMRAMDLSPETVEWTARAYLERGHQCRMARSTERPPLDVPPEQLLSSTDKTPPDQRPYLPLTRREFKAATITPLSTSDERWNCLPRWQQQALLKVWAARQGV